MLLRRITESEQCPRVALRQFSGLDRLLDRWRQVEQSNEVTHRRTIEAEPHGEFILRGVETIDVVPKRASLFDRIQIGSL